MRSAIQISFSLSARTEWGKPLPQQRGREAPVVARRKEGSRVVAAQTAELLVVVRRIGAQRAGRVCNAALQAAAVRKVVGQVPRR